MNFNQIERLEFNHCMIVFDQANIDNTRLNDPPHSRVGTTSNL